MWIFTQGTAGKRHRCLVNYFWKTESVYYSWHLGGKELELINSRGVISSCQTTLQSNFISISNLGFIGFTVEYKQSTFSRFYFNMLCAGSSKWRVIIYRLRGRAEWFWFCLCNFLMIPLPPSSLFPPPLPPSLLNSVGDDWSSSVPSENHVICDSPKSSAHPPLRRKAMSGPSLDSRYLRSQSDANL